MNRDFEDLLEGLVRSGVRFMVVGAHALAVHGYPRATSDLDVWVEASDENANRVWRALVEFGAPLAALKVGVDDFAKPDAVVQIGLPPFRVDMITGISGVAFDDAWPARVSAPFGRVGEVPFIGRAELLRNKRASGRPRDLADVAELERDRRR